MRLAAWLPYIKIFAFGSMISGDASSMFEGYFCPGPMLCFVHHFLNVPLISEVQD